MLFHQHLAEPRRGPVRLGAGSDVEIEILTEFIDSLGTFANAHGGRVCEG